MPVTRRLLTRLRRDEAGFTLIELMVSIPIGLMVMGVALDLIVRASAMQVTLSNRQEAVARGRVTMDLITRQLRSTVCLKSLTPSRSVESGDGSSVTLYVDLGDGSLPAERHVLTFDSAAGTLSERDYLQASASPVTYSATPAHNKVLADTVAAAPGVPVFSYYAFTTGGAISATRLPVPLSAADAAKTIDIAVSFIARDDRGIGATPHGTTFADDVFNRTADPTAPGQLPACI